MRIVSFILFCCFIFSCSKIQTGIDFAPRIIRNRIDDAFDLKSEKLARIKEQLAADIESSKKDLALKLLTHIDSLENLFFKGKDPTVEKIADFYNDLTETQTLLLKSFKNSAEVTLKGLSEKEIKNFKEYTDEKFSDELKLSQDKKAFLKKRGEGFEKGFDFFLGSLSSEQDKMIAEFVEGHFDFFVFRLKERQNYSDSFYLKLVAKEPVIDYFLSHYSGKKVDVLDDAKQKTYLNDLFQFQIQFWKVTTEKQKTRLKEALNTYREELKSIVEKS